MSSPFEFSRHECIDTVDGHSLAGQTLTKRQDIGVIMFTAEPRRGGVADKRRPAPRNLFTAIEIPMPLPQTAIPRAAASPRIAWANFAP